jgi:protein-disulfide isomerase
MLARYIAEDDCARYFGAIDILFRQQDQLIAQPNDTLYRVGRHYGISQEAVESCLRDQSLLDKITKNQKIASEVVKATPTFFINGEKHEGFISYEAIDRKVALMLRK